jgi:small subunit ribosomal protein S6
MREYELIVVFDLALSEAEGADAGPKYVENIITANNGTVLKIDHWGRRRMAYPIDGMLDADYVLVRLELEPSQVPEMESNFRINERILRFLTVRADELPPPPPPREETSPAEEVATTPEAAPPTASASAPAEGAAPEPAGTATAVAEPASEAEPEAPPEEEEALAAEETETTAEAEENSDDESKAE